MKNRIIYCDFDGVIVDNSDKLYSIYIKLMTGNKILPKQEYWELKKIKMPEEDIVKKTCDNEMFIKGYMTKRQEIIEDEKYLKYDKLIADSIEKVKKLKENNKIVLITKRKNKNNLFEQLNKMQISGLFDEILVSRTISKQDLISKSGLFDKERAIIIGDTEEEIKTGKNLGIKTIAVLTGIRSKEYLEKYKPDLIVKSINNIE